MSEPEKSELIEVADAGHWEGTTFVFEPPITLLCEDAVVTMSELETRYLRLAPGLSVEDVVWSLLNQHFMAPPE